MAPAAASRVRKRNRKRKRRNVSLSSSSSSSASSSEDEHPRVVPAPSTAPLTVTAINESESDSDSDSSSSASSSSSSSSSHSISSAPPTRTKDTKSGPSNEKTRRQSSRSPTPPDTALPPFISTNPTTDAEKEKEKVLKEKFRKFWMGSIAEEFKDDLEQIRKEPNMTTSRLSLLIDALASGADVFSMAAPTVSGNQINEVELVLGPSKS